MIHRTQSLFVVRCSIWYHEHNLKNVKHTHGRVANIIGKENGDIYVLFKELDIERAVLSASNMWCVARFGTIRII